jgi:mono/diheme cytochrome c family protein
MRSKLSYIVVACIMVLAVASMAFAFGDGNARKGKYLYRKHCRSCHGQTASDLSPATKTQAEWTAIFDDVTTIPCHSDWPEVNDSDINDIFTYLHDYAKDSPSPAKCS